MLVVGGAVAAVAMARLLVVAVALRSIRSRTGAAAELPATLREDPSEAPMRLLVVLAMEAEVFVSEAWGAACRAGGFEGAGDFVERRAVVVVLTDADAEAPSAEGFGSVERSALLVRPRSPPPPPPSFAVATATAAIGVVALLPASSEGPPPPPPLLSLSSRTAPPPAALPLTLDAERGRCDATLLAAVDWRRGDPSGPSLIVGLTGRLPSSVAASTKDPR